ncbi:extracellular solute-binding protein [Actinoalloteichus hymeniacidonis]|uniref:ABC-type sugar transport system, periplasmic component n=1 Tax=Actinoalloteichus hymeniacidonis TaxID=340345 RepID=A0AAC9HML2_9PSEU|nr:extracellular solute-binding protein [Actinoalloteichus hymeniacidonis]AOS61610.1 ABC-type sugar transport system, periplasmic component [Actinoalloteichus hymeniacidonis]MBB5910380.1 multiple sugar transport system substrate-binding protein [Actinoalloteichus hymeniacidonis]
MKPFTVSRRGLLTGALGIGALGALSGCSARTFFGGQDAGLRFWDLYAGGDGVNMQQMLDGYRAAHPQVSLEAVTLQWGEPYYTKLAMAGAGGRASDVAALHLARLGAYAPAGLLDPFDDELLAEVGIREEDFPAELWRRSHSGDRLFAIPFDTHPFVLYYNLDVCREAGLLDANDELRALEGPEAILDAFTAAQEITGVHGLAMETLGPDCITPWRLWYTLYRQLEGELLTPDNQASAIDDDKALEALDFMQQMTHSGGAAREMDINGSVAIFGNGQAGFHMNGEWELATFQETGVPFGMARIPKIFDTDVAQADSHVFVLPHQLDRSDREQQRNAYEFIAYLLRDSLQWAASGHLPAYQPVATSDEFLSMRPQSLYSSVAEDVQIDPPVWFGGSASRLWISFGSAFSSVLTGRATPREGLDEAKSALQNLLDTPDPTR